jgi:hypothetical protein
VAIPPAGAFGAAARGAGNVEAEQHGNIPDAVVAVLQRLRSSTDHGAAVVGEEDRDGTHVCAVLGRDAEAA